MALADLCPKQRRIFVRKKPEVTRGWVNLHSEKLYNFWVTPCQMLLKVIVCKNRWAMHVGRMGQNKDALKIWCENLEGSDDIRQRDVHCSNTCRYNNRNGIGRCGLDSYGSELAPRLGSCERRNAFRVS